MPIYAYRCEACGHTKDVLQRLSDAPLADCPACGAAAFRKQVTAAGFQLKGSGWYVTDFKGGAASASKSEDGKADVAAPAGDAKPATDEKPGEAAKPAADARPAADAKSVAGAATPALAPSSPSSAKEMASPAAPASGRE